MATTIRQPHAGSTSARASSIINSGVGGLVGGMIFGMLMQMMHMMPTVAMLVGSSSVVVGWGVHLIISMALGVGFGLVLGGRATTYGRGSGLGLVYGLLWWMVGALVLMPARLGMPVFHFDTMAWQSMMGHAMYGVALGAVSVALVRRSSVQ